MCGIFGQLHLKYKKIPRLRSSLSGSIKALKHRGPDDHNIWCNKNNSIGVSHVRLSIIDINGGSQPLTIDDNFTIAYNGEIYNFKELARDHLNGKTLSKCDTEILLRMYMMYGERSIDYIDGMFSFAIWNQSDNTLYCARDRLGIKPFYYTTVNDQFIFSSEIKAILPHLKNVEIDYDVLQEYLTFQYTIGENTIYKGIKQLLPGHSLVVRNGKILVKRYWSINCNPDLFHTEKYFTEQLSNLIEESCCSHLVSDVPVGTYVSGGIDSGIVSSICGSNQSITGYTGRFDGFNQYDESHHAKAICDKHNIKNTVVNITSKDFIENIEDVIYHLDHPVAGPGSFSQYMVARAASENHKVMLSGHGGDELFGGYAKYLIAYFEQCIKYSIIGNKSDTHGQFVVTHDTIFSNLSSLKNYVPMLKQQWSSGLFDDMTSRYFNLLNKSKHIEQYIVPGILDISSVFEKYESMFSTSHESYLDSMMVFDIKTLLPALLHVEDRISMAHGVETRVPLLSSKVVEFAMSIPGNIKFKNGELKYLLKNVARNTLPSSVTTRKDKMGFPTPFNEWCRGDIKDFIFDLLSSSKAISRGIIDNKKILANLNSDTKKYDRGLWAAVSLELWLKQNIDIVTPAIELNNVEPNTGIETSILAGLY